MAPEILIEIFPIKKVIMILVAQRGRMKVLKLPWMTQKL